MNDNPAEQDRPNDTIERLKSIAAGIFARHGVDFAAARRAGGWTNATWLAGGLALRLALRQGNDKIRREARLAALLPPEVGYPITIETGVTGGYEWSLSEEVHGACLGEIWESLSWDERAGALRGLWALAEAVHSVDLAAAGDLARRSAWYNSTDPAGAAAALTRLVAQRILTPQQAAHVREILSRFWTALPRAGCVLNHGDLTCDNALWHAGRVVSLLDFEYAVIASPAVDLSMLVKAAFEPPGENEPASAAGRQHLREVVAGLAQPLLGQALLPELLHGYAALHDLWRLEQWLAHPEGEDPQIGTWDPYRRLTSLADGQGGYLAQLVGD